MTAAGRQQRRCTTLHALLVAGAVCALGAVPASADDEDAAGGLRADAIEPLEALLAQIRRDIDGRVLEIELERERLGARALWIYEAKILTQTGNVVELYYDAETLKLLRSEGRSPVRHE